jgi:uncharacterized protein (TIGR02246 family)
VTAVALFVCVVCAELVAQQKTNPAAELAAQYEAAYNKGDVKAIGALYTADAIRVPVNGIPVVGRADIEQAYAAVFAKQTVPGTLFLSVGYSRSLSPDVVVMEGTTSTGARFLVTAVRDASQWRIASIAMFAPKAAK